MTPDCQHLPLDAAAVLKDDRRKPKLLPGLKVKQGPVSRPEQAWMPARLQMNYRPMPPPVQRCPISSHHPLRLHLLTHRRIPQA